MKKCPIHVTSAQGITQNALLITWGSKWKTSHYKQFVTVTKHKNV